MHTHEYKPTSEESQAAVFTQQLLEVYSPPCEVKVGKDGKYHYIYLTVNKHNSKFYIGKHSSSKHPDTDSYIGTGWAMNKAIKKHGREAFVNYKLKFFDNEQEAFEEEQQLVNIEYIKKYNDELRVTYNLVTGGIGGGIPSEATRKRQSEVQRGKKLSEQDKENKRKAANRPETKSAQREKRLGRKWVNNGEDEQWLDVDEALLKIEQQGWILGRKKEITSRMIEGRIRNNKEKAILRQQEREEVRQQEATLREQEREEVRQQKAILREQEIAARKEAGILKMKATFATDESKSKRRKASAEAQALKPMTDVQGNKVLVHKDNILEKLNSGYVLNVARVRLVNPNEPVGNRKVFDIRLTGKGTNPITRLELLIKLLGEGLVFGMR